MRSRTARVIVGAIAWIAMLGAGFFLFQSEKQRTELRAAVRLFDQHAREAVETLADLRAGQQAYVAAGQGVAFWMPKVVATAQTAAQIVVGLRQTAASAEARALLDQAAGTISEFGNVDARARDYIKSGQQLMAADVIFTEGGGTAVAAARQVESARLAEHQALDASEASQRRQEAMAVAGAAVAALLAIAALVPVGRLRREAAAAGETDATAESAAQVTRADEIARGGSSVLKSAARLCTDFGRVADFDGLQALLAPAADMMDASGLVVWLGSTSGGDLRPVLAHGYSAQALARMPNMPRSADNAAAAAYRTAMLQIVLSRPGTSNGAIVAPLFSPDGCIGALSAEITGGAEASDSVQALATIFAAQLAGVLSTAAATDPGQAKTASA